MEEEYNKDNIINIFKPLYAESQEGDVLTTKQKDNIGGLRAQ